MKNVIVSLINGSYLFELDYGLESNPSLVVSPEDFVSVFLEEYIYDKDYEKRKEDILKEILIPMFGEDAKELVENGEAEIPSAFLKAEEYVINNDKFVSYQLEGKLRKEKTRNSKNYEYKMVYDETLGAVSFYIKSKLFDDEIGIIIYSDGSFTPVVSTSHINITEEFKNLRLAAIKKFISIVLKVNINFGTVDGIHPLRIADLSKRAIEFAKKKTDIEYEDRESQLTTPLNGIGRV